MIKPILSVFLGASFLMANSVGAADSVKCAMTLSKSQNHDTSINLYPLISLRKRLAGEETSISQPEILRIFNRNDGPDHAYIAREFYEALEVINRKNPLDPSLHEELLKLTRGISYRMSEDDQFRLRQQFELMPEELRSSMRSRFLDATLPKLEIETLQHVVKILLLERNNGKGLDKLTLNKAIDSYIKKITTLNKALDFLPGSKSASNDISFVENVIPMMIASDMKPIALKLIKAGIPVNGALESNLVEEISNGKIMIPTATYFSYYGVKKIKAITTLDLAGLLPDMALLEELLEAGAKPKYYRVDYQGGVNVYDQTMYDTKTWYVSSLAWHAINTNWSVYSKLFKKFGFNFKDKIISEESSKILFPSLNRSIPNWNDLGVIVSPRGDTANYWDSGTTILEFMHAAHKVGQKDLVKDMLQAAERMNYQDQLREYDLPKYLELIRLYN